MTVVHRFLALPGGKVRVAMQNGSDIEDRWLAVVARVRCIRHETHLHRAEWIRYVPVHTRLDKWRSTFRDVHVVHSLVHRIDR